MKPILIAPLTLIACLLMFGSVAALGASTEIFGWMVHVYPFEQKAEDVWSVQRQASAHAD